MFGYNKKSTGCAHYSSDMFVLNKEFCVTRQMMQAHMENICANYAICCISIHFSIILIGYFVSRYLFFLQGFVQPI